MSDAIGVTGDAQDAEPFEAVLERALAFADPLALRGLLYQLTGDECLRAVKVGSVPGLFGGVTAAVTDLDDIAVLRAKTVAAVIVHDRFQ